MCVCVCVAEMMALRGLMFLTAMFMAVSIAYSIDDKCAACNAVAVSIYL